MLSNQVREQFQELSHLADVMNLILTESFSRVATGLEDMVALHIHVHEPVSEGGLQLLSHKLVVRHGARVEQPNNLGELQLGELSAFAAVGHRVQNLLSDQISDEFFPKSGRLG